MYKTKEKTLRRKLDEIYSIYIRRSAADSRGRITCYCGAVVPWQDSDCSHYIYRSILSLRYDERNTHPSCRRCNRFMGGNLREYALFLEDRYGKGILQELEKEKQRIVRNFPYQQLIDEYNQKIKNIS